MGTYTYNALGERIGKVATTPQAVTERYAYNETGQLIGEYGTTNRDYLWLGSIPVAVIDNTINGSVTTSVVNYVTADQLGTPRVVTDGTGTVIWQWAYQGNPFGEQPPTSTTGYVLNLRYPGQYYDAEDGLMYNGARYYEPGTGRFPQSDPIGLFGGQWSTYAYVGGAPLSLTDPSGLCPSKKCSDALATIHKTAKSVQNANDNWITIALAASENNIDPALLAAIGVRESGFLHMDQKGGNGKGVFQIDVGMNPQVSIANAENINYAANWTAAQLAQNYAWVTKHRPDFTPEQKLQAAAAGYNAGYTRIPSDPSQIDAHTINHYGKNVMDLMDCFPY